jgi:hypothetical protein
MRQAGVMTLNHGEGDRLTGTEIQGLDKLGVKIKKFEKQNKKKTNKNTRVNDLHHVLNSFLYDFYMSSQLVLLVAIPLKCIIIYDN